ncbi:MAG: DUF1016 domain-containing protein [Dechloromonas sp.]|nr:MAG: DUF1016 domain-containing protein [Dechloromonas sp.]
MGPRLGGSFSAALVPLRLIARRTGSRGAPILRNRGVALRLVLRQLDRQIASQFYERTALSRTKTAMLTKGTKTFLGDKLSADEELKDPLLLEFWNLNQTATTPTLTFDRP